VTCPVIKTGCKAKILARGPRNSSSSRDQMMMMDYLALIAGPQEGKILIKHAGT
jgi:hypothetical protein